MSLLVENNSNKDEKLLCKHIKTITNSGLDTIDAQLWENIKVLFKKCPKLIDKAFQMVMIELRKPHAQVRYSAFKLCDELFKRSHNFRLHVIEKLEEILELSAEINPNKKLPLPKEVADKLKEFSLGCILDWKCQFNERYPALVDQYLYLSRCKNIDFDAVRRKIEADNAVKAEREREQERVRRLMFDSFLEEFNAHKDDIEEAIQVINNSTSLLIPTLDDFFVSNNNDDNVDVSVTTDTDEDFDMRLFGLRPSYNLDIQIDQKLRVVRTEENASILDNLMESVKLVKKRFFKLVEKWSDIVEKYSQDSSYTNRVVELKTQLNACMKKYEELNILEDDSDDDADMVEVFKEGFEPYVLPVIAKNPEPQPGPSCSKSSTEEPLQGSVPDWQDPILLAQLKATTGIDLKMPEKKKKGLKMKRPTLTDEVKQIVKAKHFPGISIIKKNPKERLMKKIFNRVAVKKVAESYKKYS